MKDVVPEHSFFNEMRGETSATFDMSSAFLQAGIRPMTGYQQPGSVALQSQSPEPACQFYPIIPKQEMIDDSRNDSGINTSPSASPGSEHNENITNPLGTSPNHESTPAQSQYPWYMTSPNNMEETNSPSPSYQSSISPKMDCGDENIDDEEKKHSVPKVNSHGKIKVHKCKQCTFVAYTKLDFWKHSRVHIKGDKILSCPRCPFVTEYKHHLEYHLLNHAGAKPFKCEHCDYSCVNKSMLNSHMKSHSNVYQYRCSDCLYETKYCHSLKLHLRKYNHQPAMMLDPDGSPNPVPIIDVYGTRRGPKLKKVPKTSPKPPTPPPMEPQQTQLPYNPAINPLMPPMPYPFQMPSFPPNPQVMENLQRLVKAQMEELVRQQNAALMQGGVLDLSKSAVSNNNNNNNSDDDEEETTMFSNVEAVVDKKDDAENMEEEVEDKEEPSSPVNNNKYEFECQFCSISFGDEVLFRIHMGYHGYTNPFTCNSCGEECKDKVNFCLHMARAPH